MRIISFVALFSLIFIADASANSLKKKGTDVEGNCIPQLVAENARLFGELETLDQIATRSETQLKSELKESQKKGFEGLKELSAKAKVTQRSIKSFGDLYSGVVCKAQVVKGGKPQVITMNITEKVAALEKFATTYQQIADKFLATHLAVK